MIVVAVRGSSFSVVAGKIVDGAVVVIVVVVGGAVLVVVVVVEEVEVVAFGEVVVVLVVVDVVIGVVYVVVLISVVVAEVVTSLASTLLIDGVDISMSNKDSVSSFGGGPEVFPNRYPPSSNGISWSGLAPVLPASTWRAPAWGFPDTWNNTFAYFSDPSTC